MAAVLLNILYNELGNRIMAIKDVQAATIANVLHSYTSNIHPLVLSAAVILARAAKIKRHAAVERRISAVVH
jgi:hypothetical protein